MRPLLLVVADNHCCRAYLLNESKQRSSRAQAIPASDINEQHLQRGVEQNDPQLHLNVRPLRYRGIFTNDVKRVTKQTN